MKDKKTREAAPGELSEIQILEDLERLSKRPETRLDAQNMLEALSPNSQTYVRHLVTSGPSNLEAAAKACNLQVEEVEAAINEIQTRISAIFRGK